MTLGIILALYIISLYPSHRISRKWVRDDCGRDYTWWNAIGVMFMSLLSPIIIVIYVSVWTYEGMNDKFTKDPPGYL